jgi:serine protease
MNLSSRRFATLALAAMLLVTGTATLHATAHADPRDDAPSAADTSTSGNEAPDTHAADTDAPVIEVEAAAPRFTDPDEGFYVIPEIEGVEYVLEREGGEDWVLRPGLHRLDDAYSTLTARAQPGHRLTAEASWHYAYPQNMAPTFNDQLGTGEDTFHIPSRWGGPHFEYRVNGVVTDWGHHPGAGEVVIEVTPLRTGYEMIGPTRWEHTFTDITFVTLRTPPTFDVARSRYTIPRVTGVQFLVDGTVKAPGTYAANGPITIRSQAAPGYFLATEEWWSHDFTPYFVDVRVGMPHYEHMVWMAETGISLGWRTDRGMEYRPLAPVNRDAMAAFLYRMAGSPAVKLPATSPFTDITARDPHYRAVVWAYQQKITTGWVMPDGTRRFRPTAPIGRDAMAAFLYRFAGSPTVSMPTGSCFIDVPRTRQFAQEICWMKTTGISTGWPDRTYRPEQSITRDAMAAFLHRYDGAH